MFKWLRDIREKRLEELNKRIMKRVILASGYFDPFHIGHLEYLEKAKQLGDQLVVIINNDHQARQKKGYNFMPAEERRRIIQGLKCVDHTFISVDQDPSVRLSIVKAYHDYSKITTFAKGGDRTIYNIPERSICDQYGIQIIDGLGNKIRSSSDLVRRVSGD